MEKGALTRAFLYDNMWVSYRKHGVYDDASPWSMYVQKAKE